METKYLKINPADNVVVAFDFIIGVVLMVLLV